MADIVDLAQHGWCRGASTGKQQTALVLVPENFVPHLFLHLPRLCPGFALGLKLPKSISPLVGLFITLLHMT